MKYLFTTDGHFGTKRPVARKEKTDAEYMDNQLAKREQLLDYAIKIQARILDGGDFFQYWKMDNSSELLIAIVNLFKDRLLYGYYSNIGNHDLPYHNLDNINQSLLGLLVEFGVVNIEKYYVFENVYVRMFQYGEELVDHEHHKQFGKTRIAVVHENIFQSSVPPYMSGYTAQELVTRLPDFDVYLCGHNHEQFVWSDNKRIVVNGGSTMRLNTKQVEYKPAFWEISIDEPIEKATMHCGNIWVKKHEYIIQPDMISLDHLKNKKIEAFVESTRDFAEGESFDFRKDVENELEVRGTVDNVKAFVYNALEG